MLLYAARERKQPLHARLTRGNMKRIFINPFSQERVRLNSRLCMAKGNKRVRGACQ